MQEMTVLLVAYILVNEPDQQILIIDRQVYGSITGEVKQYAHE
jgi:hypothetical protein